MGKPTGFLEYPRELPMVRPPAERIHDWSEFHEHSEEEQLRQQGARCMDCGIPFCHIGCPLGNLIPEWNDLVWRSDWDEALERLHATNNFPEFTGRLCPAPCETACVVGINRDPVTIKNVEVAIIDKAWDERRVTPQPPEWHTGKTVAVVGSGPAGLAAAQQLTRAGHTVAVFERADEPGGLLRYGIPEFKMEKAVLDRRIRQMKDEGTNFRCGVEVGVDITGPDLRERYDAVVLATGSTIGRDLPVPGRDLAGIHQAMEYLPQANRAAQGMKVPNQITAHDKHVVIIGGGDTGADCLGTAIRQQAKSIVQLEIMPEPPSERPASQPWPTYPMIYRVSSAHEEAGERAYSVSTSEFKGDESGRVRSLTMSEVRFDAGKISSIEGTEREIPAELVLLAMGFTGPETDTVVSQLGVSLDQRGNVARGNNYETDVDGVFVCGDAGRGQSLIVWAISEGRACAAGVDEYLSGSTKLPRPIPPTARPMMV